MDSKARLFSSAPGWPSFIDLKCGGAITIERRGRAWAIRLISVRVEKSPDWRSGAVPGNKMFKEAKVLLEVDGRQCLLRLAPLTPPVCFQGLRLHVETVKALNSINASARESLHYDARISAMPDSDPWTPLSFRFPIPGHLWRSNPCYGVWGALNCGDSSRYCDGFNLGASQDACSVIASLPGTVKSIVQQQDGQRLATISLEHIHGVRSVYGNIDAASIPADVKEGKPIDLAAPLGKVSLENVPPYLHFGLVFEGVRVSPYPALLESYMRESSDGAAAFAGGHLFCLPGERLQIDAASTLATRPERSVASCVWHLSDGSRHEGSQIELSYKSPGFLSEELRVVLDDGQEFRDAVHVRVFKPGERGQTGFPGWISHSPAASAKPDAKILFRLMTMDDFKIESLDFGDGTSSSNPPRELSHSYGNPGIYTVEAKGSGPDGTPVSLKRFVRVMP